MRRIRRRDFLNGVAMAAGGAFAPPAWLLALEDAPEKAPGYYPPALTGLRGSHEGSYLAGHEVRDGRFAAASLPAPDEEYDLVVVGGGLSGLTAAYLFRKKAGPTARILVLDNHDDFGGHAKRNEFSEGGRTLLGGETGRVPESLELPTGRVRQRLPMTSAVRVGGERLYKKAHRGEVVETPEREVDVYRAQLLDSEGDEARYEIECSAGTYIRTLVETLEDAYCEELRRTAIGPFAIEDAGAELDLGQVGALVPAAAEALR